jgi:hypothetical protein
MLPKDDVGPLSLHRLIEVAFSAQTRVCSARSDCHMSAQDDCFRVTNVATHA